MKKFNVDSPPNWTPRNSLEDHCLLFGDEVTQSIPLYHAVTLRWPELSGRLLELGANPQAQIPKMRYPGFPYLNSPWPKKPYYTEQYIRKEVNECERNPRSPPSEWGEYRKWRLAEDYWNYWLPESSESVISAVIRATRNHRGEAEDLLHKASRLGVPNIISQIDVLTILILQDRRESIRWSSKYGCRLSFKAGGFKLAPGLSHSLWNAIQRADSAQAIPLRAQDKDASLMFNAARCCSSIGIDALLQMGFDVNDPLKRVMSKDLRLRANPLDMVSWTARVRDTDRDSVPSIREEDVFIADMLRKRGAIRGWEYTWEYQSLRMFVRTCLLPRTIIYLGTNVLLLLSGIWCLSLWFPYVHGNFYKEGEISQYPTSDYVFSIIWKSTGVFIVSLYVPLVCYGAYNAFGGDSWEMFDRARSMGIWFHGGCGRLTTFRFLRIGVLDGFPLLTSSTILSNIGRVKTTISTLFTFSNRWAYSCDRARYVVISPSYIYLFLIQPRSDFNFRHLFYCPWNREGRIRLDDSNTNIEMEADNTNEDRRERDQGKDTWLSRYIRAAKNGRRVGRAFAKFSLRWIVPAVVFPLRKTIEVCDQVARYSRQAELRRSQRRRAVVSNDLEYILG